MKLLKKIVVLMVVIMPVLLMADNKPKILDVKFEPDNILIGDHIILSIDVEKDMTQVVGFPGFDKKSFGGRIELIKEFVPDTLSVEGRVQRIRKRYLLTSFEEGVYNLDSLGILYLDKNIVDTIIYPKEFQILVETIPIDTLKSTIFDVKPQMQAPLLVDEVKGYAIGLVLSVLVIISLLYFWSNRRRSVKIFDTSKPKELPHIVAIRDLEQLHNQKIWQNNKHKQYYTRLTDILREYLDGRFEISAHEMITDEIVAEMKKKDISVKQFKESEEILRSADLVKFAKHIPNADENEDVYTKVYYFVEETKQIEEEKSDENSNEKVEV